MQYSCMKGIKEEMKGSVSIKEQVVLCTPVITKYGRLKNIYVDSQINKHHKILMDTILVYVDTDSSGLFINQSSGSISLCQFLTSIVPLSILNVYQYT